MSTTSEHGSYIGAYDSFVCEGCLDYNYFYCEECGEYYPNDQAQQVGNQAMCEDCASDNSFECRECGNRFHTDEDYGHECCGPCCDDLQGERDDLVDEINENETRMNPTFHTVPGRS